VEYLSLHEILSSKEKIQQEMDFLFSNKIAIGKPNSNQWQFFRNCFNVLFNSQLVSDFGQFPDNKDTYTFPNRETNRQSYILKKDKGIWKVFQFIRPQPRTSVPHRRNYNVL
jgi:hypothetical protein